MRTDTRDTALSVLLQVVSDRAKSGSALGEAFGREGLDARDKAFIKCLVIGTLRRLVTIDGILSGYLKKPLRFQNPVLLMVLRLSAYEVLYMDRVPDSAAVDEGVELLEAHGLSGLKGVANAVLRRLCRDRESGLIADIIESDDRLKYSMPGWLIGILKSVYGDHWEDTAAKLLNERNVTLRFNLSRAGEEYTKALIEGEGYKLLKVDMGLISGGCYKGPLPVVYELCSGGDISASRAFREGLISVQDPSSALAAYLAEPRDGDMIIDVAAAPGGKSIALADLMRDSGSIEARDISSAKAQLIAEDIERTGVSSVKVRVADALALDEESLYRADIVIADLPCSGLGVIAKKPDILLHMKPEAIRELAMLQEDMLAVCSRYVRPGGKLIYSTCTLTKEENEYNTAKLISEGSFALISETRIDPGETHDGFYIAVLKRRY